MAVKCSVSSDGVPANVREAAVCLALAKGKTTSFDIAGVTGYKLRTVQRALFALRRRGIVQTKIWYEGRERHCIWHPPERQHFRNKVVKAAKRVVADQQSRSENVSVTRRRRRNGAAK